MAAVVFAICINEISPSCILAPPEVVKETKGIFSSDAVSAARVTFSPTTLPMLPPMKSKSMTEIITSIPAIFDLPVTKDWIRQLVLAQVLIGHTSFHGVMELLRHVRLSRHQPGQDP